MWLGLAVAIMFNIHLAEELQDSIQPIELRYQKVYDLLDKQLIVDESFKKKLNATISGK